MDLYQCPENTIPPDEDTFSPSLLERLEDISEPRVLLQEEIELKDRPESEISHWWKTLTLMSYFTIVASGLASSISIGDLLAAFQNNCIFYGKLSLKDIELGGNLTLREDSIVVDKWGEFYDCSFCEYASVFSSVFGGMLFAMFLQCGRGGMNSESGSRSWEIVLPALVITIIFFIISTVIFAKTVGGLAFFCSYILRDSHSPVNITSCQQIFEFRYPWDYYETDLYLDYIFAQVGTSLTFGGWLTSLTILIFRCLLGVDFVAYRKRSYAAIRMHNSTYKDYKSQKVRQRRGENNVNIDSHSDSSLTNSSIKDSDISEDETTFVTVVADLERKKLI